MYVVAAYMYACEVCGGRGGGRELQNSEERGKVYGLEVEKKG